MPYYNNNRRGPNARRPNRDRHGREQRPDRSGRPPISSDPSATGSENLYYQKLRASQATVVITLIQGEQLEGLLQWYDQSCLKIAQENGPGLLIPKSNIKYIYTLDETSEEPAEPTP